MPDAQRAGFRFVAGRRPHVWAGVCGLLAGLTTLLLCVVGLGYQYSGQLAAAQKVTVDRVTAIFTESIEVLKKLNTEFKRDCSEGDLIRMRQVLFASRFVRDIGLYDDRNAMYCTTAVGRLADPIATSGGLTIQGSAGNLRTIWFDTPLRLGDGNFSATVIQQGRFNVVIDPFATDEVYRLGAHLFWARLYDGEPSLVTTVKYPGDALLAEFKSAITHGTPFAGFSWANMAFMFSDAVPGTSLYVQSFGRVSDIFQWNSWLAWGAVVLSVLLGHLAFWSLLPHFIKFGSLAHRLRFLLQPQHLICLFQPIVELETRRCVGCEVLMRLQDGSDVVYPDNVIPAIMVQGLTWELDRAVIIRALGDLAAVLPGQAVLKIALNIFPANVRFEALHQLIQGRLAELGVTGWAINVEVIEQDYDPEVIAQVEKLKKAGYLVSVDDFGTGYSNLGSIKTLSPHFLKIDKSFVFDMEDASLRSSLIPEIVGIARAVGSQVVAEGVENALQAEQLQAYGVQLGQGYFFAKPMPAQDFARFWQQHEVAANLTASSG